MATPELFFSLKPDPEQRACEAPVDRTASLAKHAGNARLGSTGTFHQFTATTRSLPSLLPCTASGFGRESPCARGSDGARSAETFGLTAADTTAMFPWAARGSLLLDCRLRKGCAAPARLPTSNHISSFNFVCVPRDELIKLSYISFQPQCNISS